MSSDPLEPLDALDALVDAYRAETAHRDRDARALRARVIIALGARRRVPRPFIWLGAAAVLFAGSAALAAGGERTVTRLLEWLRPEPAETKAPVERERLTRHPRRITPSPAQISPPPSSPADPVDTSGVAVPLSALPLAVPLSALPLAVPLSALPLDGPPAAIKVRSTARRAELPAPPAAVAPKPDLAADLSMYRRAHALHFGGGKPAEALDAWREYLHEHPRGALAAEARLNEAVCLVKLGRRAEGGRILEALATGNAPQSTQRQASELLLALGTESTR